MISGAINALNEDGGSTAASIDAFIRAKYNEDLLPQAHSNLFPYHLSKLLHLGEIRQSATGLYIVTPEDYNSPNPNSNPYPPTTPPPPTDTSTPPESPVKKRKRRGRPPRPKPETEQHQQTAAAAATNGDEDVPRRRRGRPPRKPAPKEA
ncbi:hypothetical protein ACLOJK_025999 [Asimina triloba]